MANNDTFPHHLVMADDEDRLSDQWLDGPGRQQDIQERWFHVMIRNGNIYYGKAFTPHFLWMVLRVVQYYLIDPFANINDYTFPLGRKPFPHDPKSDFPKHEDPENPGHLLIFVADDAPLYLEWEAGYPTLAQEYRDSPKSSFLSSRLKFYRHMHRWMYVANYVVEGYKLLLTKALDLGLDPQSIYLLQFIEKPATLSCDAWLEAHIEDEDDPPKYL
jgi:hypothetical protein